MGVAYALRPEEPYKKNEGPILDKSHEYSFGTPKRG